MLGRRVRGQTEGPKAATTVRCPGGTMLRVRFALTWLVVALLSACSRSTPTAPSGSTAASLDLALETTHFVLLYNEQNANMMEAYAAALESAYRRIATDLAQNGLPRITGRFYPDQVSYSAYTGNTARGSVQSRNEFSMVAAPLDPSIAVHEFAHCVTLHLDRNSGNNPTWLWEAVAIFEAEQFVDPRSVPCLANRQFPTLTELNQRGGDCDIYRVGYTLTEHLVEGWGFEGLRDLIASHGDIPAVLGLSTSQFEAGWQRFIEEHYL